MDNNLLFLGHINCRKPTSFIRDFENDRNDFLNDEKSRLLKRGQAKPILETTYERFPECQIITD